VTLNLAETLVAKSQSHMVLIYCNFGFAKGADLSLVCQKNAEEWHRMTKQVQRWKCGNRKYGINPQYFTSSLYIQVRYVH